MPPRAPSLCVSEFKQALIRLAPSAMDPKALEEAGALINEHLKLGSLEHFQALAEAFKEHKVRLWGVFLMDDLTFSFRRVHQSVWRTDPLIVGKMDAVLGVLGVYKEVSFLGHHNALFASVTKMAQKQPDLLLHWLSSPSWAEHDVSRITVPVYEELVHSAPENPIERLIQQTLTVQELSDILHYATEEYHEKKQWTSFKPSIEKFLSWAQEKPEAWWDQVLDHPPHFLQSPLLEATFPEWSALMEKHLLLRCVDASLSGASSKRKI